MPASTPKTQPAARNPLVICVCLAALSFAVYARSLFNGFVNYDDHEYITDNAHVRSGLSGETLRWAFTTYTTGNWHPLTWLSHALDAQIFGLVPAGHHISSIIFHCLNVVLLFLILWRATGFRGRALVVAALFAVHPLNVECVAWAAERKSLLSTLLFFLALGAYGWYAKKPSATRYGAVALLFALGLMSKPMVITLPFVLLLLDYWPLRRIDSWTLPRAPWSFSRKPPSVLLEKLPLLLLSVASAVITVVAQSRSGAVVPLSAAPLPGRIENALCSYGLYLLKAVWPLGLGVLYPQEGPKLVSACLALMALLAISVWVWRERKQRAYLVVGWLWYLGTLVPVIGLVQVGLQAMADRYAYIPLIGVFVMLVWRIAEFCDSVAIPMWQRTTAGAFILLVLAALTWRQVGYWRDPVTLWAHTLQVTKNNVVAEDNLGAAFMKLGRDAEAATHFENAVRLRPEEPKARIGLAYLSQKHGNASQAIEQCEIALSHATDPDDLLAIYMNLGVAYRATGDYKAAGNSFKQVLQLDPSNGVAMTALGKMILLQAAERLSRDVDRHPSADGFSQLGSLWEQAGDLDHAKHAYQSALALNAKQPTAQDGLDRLSRMSP